MGYRKHGAYMKAKQFKRARSVLKSLKTKVGRVMRDVEHKIEDEAFDRSKGTLLRSELS